MLKFLRKYQMWILAIGGSLLMVAFLLPQALQQLGSNPQNATYLRIDGRKVSMERANLAARELAALDGIAQGGIEVAVGIQSPDHWLLLSDLAERSGYVGDQRDGSEFFAEAVRQLFLQVIYMTGRGWMLENPQFQQVLESQIQAIQDRRGDIRDRASLTDEQFNMALAKLRGVMRMMEARSASGRFSRPRIVAEAQRRHNEAEIEYVFIDAESRMSDVPEPTDEQIAAHFEAYKDSRPGDGDYGFGYLLPKRVKLEWLVLDQAEIAAAVEPDEVEIQGRLLKHMEQNPEADEEQAYQTIADQVRSEAVQEVMRIARQAIQLQVDVAQRGLPTDGEYLVLPPDYAETRPSLEALADAVVQRVQQDPRVRVRPFRPQIERREEWLTQTELSALPGIGRASLPRGTQAVPFPLMALNVREIADAGVGGLGLQAGILQPRPVQDRIGNQYYFRVLAAREESAPDSVDEIREEVAEDVRELHAYQALVEERDALLEQAVAEGIDAVAQSASGTDVGPVQQEDAVQVQSAVITRVSATVPELNTEPFRTAVIDMAEDLDPTVAMDTIDARARTLARGIDESLGLAVAQIAAWRPVSLERYRTLDRTVARRLAVEQTQEDEYAPFSYDVLLERLNVEFPRSRQEDDAEEAEESGGEPDSEAETEQDPQGA